MCNDPIHLGYPRTPDSVPHRCDKDKDHEKDNGSAHSCRGMTTEGQVYTIAWTR